ncbi:MAG: 3-hydroxyacyl-CoA dehydrogenase [Sulfobacillus acidophilus]|uniref:3-hydroxyacyl-CoA dehydrogenase n=1 Tax=Sulfobacillus acidophilus TaxID=53633 RepID=A0A2T2WLR0_9FIRM|nr:MAG: 3-hydroxyacyl-CoA dehydrogenase [Sulfobacillus acidophilus]
MTEVVRIFGCTPHQADQWARGAKVSVQFCGDSQCQEAQGASWVIDAGLGPLQAKRARLRQLRAVGVKSVLSASTTATIAAQRQWLGDAMHVIGCDPLLMLAQGTRQTVVNASDEDRAWLGRVWPDRTFIAVQDTVGLVFSREVLPIINEAVNFLHQGLPPEEIDQAVRLGLNYPRGPFQWAELFGWPAVYWGLAAMHDMFGPRFRPHPWIRAQVGSSLAPVED